MMKNFKKLLALALCAIMVIGIVPMTAGNSEVKAADEVEAVIQGPNDAVVVYDVDLVLREAFGAFVGNKVLTQDKGKCGVGGTTSGAAYDRIIFVMAISDRLGSAASTAFEASTSGYGFTNCENIVITSACYAEYTDNIYLYSGTTFDSLMTYNTAKLFGKADPFTDNLIDKTDSVVFRLIENGNAHVVHLASDISFEYITLKFDVNVLFYLSGFDFYVSDTVKFTYAGTTDGYKPIILNGNNGTSRKINPETNQTITLNGGEYQYVTPRTRNVTYKTFENYNITLNLGEVTLVRNSEANVTALFSNDYYDNTTMTVNINGTTFKAPVYLVQGGTNSKATAPTVKGCTLNINVTDADFQKGVAVVGPVSTTGVACDVQSLAVNMHIVNCTVGDGYTIEGQTEDTAAAITAKVEYTEGAALASSLGSFDTVTTFEGDLCAGGHTYVPAVVADAACYACVRCNEVDESKTVTFDDETGAPIIYVSYGNGNDANDGLTADTAVQNIYKATEILSAWQMGGYVVYTGTAVQRFSAYVAVGGINSTVLHDVGGTLYIDGNYNNINGEAGTQSEITSYSGFVYFESDTVFKNIKLTDVTSQKVFILNYNDLDATENCTMVNPSRYNYTLIAGTFNSGTDVIAKYATNKVVDQQVVIDGFSFQTIMAGSKSVQKDANVTDDNPEGLRAVRFSREYSVGCSGVTNIYLGANSKVEAINIRKYHINSVEGVLEQYSAPDVRITMEAASVPAAGIKFVQNNTHLASTRVYNYDSTSENYMMFDDDRALIIYGDDLSDIATVFTVVDSEAFASLGIAYNEAASAARVTFAEVENSLQGDEIAEFGVLFTVPEFSDDVYYVYETGDQGLIAKSLCYDKAENVLNYLYDGENPAYFHGVIKLDDAALSEYLFDATPYAVVDVAAADGVAGSVAAQYCVIGTAVNDCFANIVPAN